VSRSKCSNSEHLTGAAKASPTAGIELALLDGGNAGRERVGLINPSALLCFGVPSRLFLDVAGPSGSLRAVLAPGRAFWLGFADVGADGVVGRW
jgi:hypothetical protein